MQRMNKTTYQPIKLQEGSIKTLEILKLSIPYLDSWRGKQFNKRSRRCLLHTSDIMCKYNYYVRYVRRHLDVYQNIEALSW